VATTAQRRHLHDLMRYTLAHEPQIHYAQVRPMRTVRLSEAELHTLLGHGHTITMDCSEGVTCLCKWAGLRDPNGLHYDGQGYTGTLLSHLTTHYTDPHRAKVGALCVFGPAPGDHVAMVMEPGSDPLMWSHGYEGGPRKVRFSAERAIHRRPATFLSIAAL
jgi:hypothetical protein